MIGLVSTLLPLYFPVQVILLLNVLMYKTGLIWEAYVTRRYSVIVVIWL
jgi:hypothetical protein